MTSETRDELIACDWPLNEVFRFYDPDTSDIHGPVFLIMPGGAMVKFHHHGSETVDIARAKWIMDACNARIADALSRSAPAGDRDAIIEECAKVAEAEAVAFGSDQYALGQPQSSFGERFACKQIAASIRALKSGDAT